MAKATGCSLTSSTDGGYGEGEGAPALICAGRVGRPHGLDGAFHVSAARARLLTPGLPVRIGDRELTVERRSGTEQRPVLSLAGIGDRDAAISLRGLEIVVAAERAPALGEGEWWAHELQGCVVCDGQHAIGEVLRLIELPSCEVLEVSREHGQALLVPMVKDAIRSIDVKRRQIDVDLRFLGDTA